MNTQNKQTETKAANSISNINLNSTSLQTANAQDLIPIFESAKTLFEKNAENIKLLDLSKTSGFADYFLIASGRSAKQIQTMADFVVRKLKSLDIQNFSIEGTEACRWVLIDYGYFVVHLFQDELRDYYDLEGLWSHSPRVPLPKELFAPAASPTLE